METGADFVIISVLLGIAAAFDVFRHRIPNALTVAVLVTAIVARALTGELAAVGSGIAAGLAAGAFLWPAWTRRMIGGGDLKLAVAASVWVGLGKLSAFAAASALALGAVAVACFAISSRAARLDIQGNLARGGGAISALVATSRAGGRVQVPAGAAFAVGAVLVVWWS